MKNLFAAIIALLLPVLASAQFSISGKVTNQAGEALPGATVTITNPATNTQTDVKGNYQIGDLPAGNYTIKASYIGYQITTQAVNLTANLVVNFSLTNTIFSAEEVTITATRAGKNSPTAFTNLSKKDIQKNNFGQDLPYMLAQTPSVVVSSDGGTGIGYTGIRIRGSDGTRINVTVNGIPLNDAESQGSYFVDLPDLTSSVNNIQVQRGVGTSTNGAGAFGGSINIQTNTRRDTGFADINNTVGSYGTVKNTVSLGTGLLNGHFSFDGRLSRIRSNGYIDRASSNLRSFFLSGAYYDQKSTLRLNVFSGVERTYQAWNGVPDYVIGDPTRKDSRTYNELGLMPDGTFYKDQVDNYQQNHYQLLYDRKLTDKLAFSGALHYTKGFGYYEEFKADQAVTKYKLTPVVVGGTPITHTDLARRLWLNNDFYGVTYALKYQAQSNLNFTLGGAYNRYTGAHYGNIIYTAQSAGITPNYEYYRDNAKKTDFNIFGRGEYKLGDVTLFADLQYRRIDYSFLGFDRNLNNVQQDAKLNFFNPKAGITYEIDEHNNVYASFAVGNHEPNRDDYTNSTPASRPKPENLKDFEAGYRTSGDVFKGGVNLFYMLYKNQLILTGALNDVGSATRINVDDSYRAGIEVDGRVKITQQLSWAANATVSTNKIKNLSRTLASYDGDYNPLTPVTQIFKKTDIAYSPSLIVGSEIAYSPIPNGSIAFVSKYVSRQFLDNTGNVNPTGISTSPDVANNPYAVNRLLKAYFVNDVRLSYNIHTKAIKNIGLGLLVNNIFSKKYEANGATYPEVDSGVLVNYNYYFPQAPRNFLASVSLSF
ncbi:MULTISPECIES: TonB-dependent receptor [unclassified Mucilaginibacter]|uniref:TonB-dependent receptor n=1 Tax=unclassified Mucilaginibacter TaxID=2617802 RepID=UPI002AC9CF59|nr:MULTISPECIES: TonB-dependent receptor [unclassified Mucilaginibacter]MEB0278411.1 TonB-dependent receptor [Mucilaginibacter sp. 10B2]MEB0302230.1 TonB-dependent receptor [Mucilaginibacter sp. 5C4]WPX24056.1 TonB-dependent receptor [Mucilaginibacter sp. 5C4]